MHSYTIFVVVVFGALSSLSLAQLSDKTDIQIHLGPPETKDSLTYIAVFLLSTLAGAPDFGGPGGDRTDFFQRVKASKATWAHPIKHFYSVVGNSDDNTKILVNPQYCTNLTKQYHHHMNHAAEHPREEVFECAGIRVLYLPYCDHKSWGAKGPCCRSEGAMRYYMNNYAAHPDYPSWFLFADDDYFVRTYKLWGILSNLNPALPYGIQPTPNNANGMVSAGNHMVHRITDWAMWFGNHNCSIPCTSGSSWLALSIFSIGAIRVMESEIRKNGLIRVCEVFKTTHDVGLGIFVWEHSLTTLQMCCGANGYSDHTLDRAVWWHEMGRTERGRDLANVMLEKVWKHGATKRGETKPDLTKFIEYEYQDGLQHTFPPIADGGFINSLFYRKVQFSEALARQIPPHQLVNMTNFPLRKTEFSHADCNIEMDFHLKWRREHSDKYPLKDIKKTAADENPRSDYLYRLVSNAPHLPKMCADYLEAVQNEPVHYSDLPAVPDFETLERRTRKMLRENVSVTATAISTATVVDTLES